MICIKCVVLCPITLEKVWIGCNLRLKLIWIAFYKVFSIKLVNILDFIYFNWIVSDAHLTNKIKMCHQTICTYILVTCDITYVLHGWKKKCWTKTLTNRYKINIRRWGVYTKYGEPDIFATTAPSGLKGPSRARQFKLLCRKTPS